MKTTMWAKTKLAAAVVGAFLAVGAGGGTAAAEPVNKGAKLDGVQLWNSGYSDTVAHADFYGPNFEKLKPVLIFAARNGVFSGRVIATCASGPIKGLKAKASDLVSEDGKMKIPAGQVRIRYAEPARPEKCGLPTYRYDGLLDAAPAETPPVDMKGQRNWAPKNAGALAMIPIWITVRVPADAAAGEYQGTISVEAEGNPAVEVPVRLKVYGWTLPAPKDFRINHLDFHSAESVAKHYNLPLWSDKHFEYMGKSLALMAEVGARRVWMDLVINFAGQNAGNDESAIRWIRNADGTYKHDFTVFDKYLDMVAKSIGKPFPLRLNCWPEMQRGKDGKYNWIYAPRKVSLLDPATGKVEPMEMPAPDETMKDCLAFWKPALDEARKKIEARGWFDVTCLGHNMYVGAPTPQVVSMAKNIWPDGIWSNTSHAGTIGVYKGIEKDTTMPCLYAECEWNEGPLTARGYRALLKREPKAGLWCADLRCRHGEQYNRTDMHVYRNLPEEIIMRGHDGVGQLGVDFFPVKDGRGRFRPLANDRGGTGPVNSTQALLAPGPEGPIATERFEMFREGVQIGEALIFLERALGQNKIAGELAGKVNAHLDARGGAFIKNSDDYSRKVADSPEKRERVKAYIVAMQERDEALFALCAEAAKAMGLK